MSEENKGYRVGYWEKRWFAAMFLVVFGVFASIHFCGCAGSQVSQTTLRAVDTTIMAGCQAYQTIVHPLVQRDLAGSGDAGVQPTPKPIPCMYERHTYRMRGNR